MNAHTFPSNPQPVEERRFLGVPIWIKADRARTDGRLSLVEQVIPAGMESPWHVHRTEDESFYVLSGRMTVIVGDTVHSLTAGDYAFGPRGVPHGFRIEGSEPARILLMTNGGDFADFIRETSVAKDAAPTEPDLAAFAAAADRHNLTIFGPLPA